MSGESHDHAPAEGPGAEPGGPPPAFYYLVSAPGGLADPAVETFATAGELADRLRTLTAAANAEPAAHAFHKVFLFRGARLHLAGPVGARVFVLPDGTTVPVSPPPSAGPADDRLVP